MDGWTIFVPKGQHELSPYLTRDWNELVIPKRFNVTFAPQNIKLNLMGPDQGNVKSLNKREFKQKIYDYTFSKEWEYKGDMPAVIDFYADWCKPCKVVAPIISQLSEEYEGRVNFYKLNTEKDPEVARFFGISSIPTIMFIPPEGKPVMVRGAQPKFMLRKNIERMLPGEKKGFSLKDLFSFGKRDDK